jgi:two-component system response regulator YesN
VSRYIADHFAEPLNTAAIASLVACHGTTLRRAFKRRIGMSMKDFQIRCRVRKALEMLGTGLKVQAVSQSVGYRSDRNFYNEFRRVTGLTPAAARKRSDELLAQLRVGTSATIEQLHLGIPEAGEPIGGLALQ